MVEVVNMKTCKDWGKPGDVRVDRTTKWGNPFILYSEPQRDRVCDQYEIYFKDSKLNINELKVAKRLVCHCSLKRCHADFLKSLIDHLDKQNTLF